MSCLEVNAGFAIHWRTKSPRQVAADKYPGSTLLLITGPAQRSIDPMAPYCDAYVVQGMPYVTLVEIPNG